MLAQPKNRVQAIKSKFESLNSENDSVLLKKKTTQLKLNKHNIETNERVAGNGATVKENIAKCSLSHEETIVGNESDSSVDEWSAKPNSSYLYSVNDVKRSLSDAKSTLSRQISDPGKKLQRRDAFRCDRNLKINHSPKRHDSCKGRSETSDFSLKMGEKKLSKQRLKQLGNFLEDHMKKENFQPLMSDNNVVIVGQVLEIKTPDSIPDSQVPKHILDQYAKVVKKTDKQDSLTDSGVSSETENLDEDKSNKSKSLTVQCAEPEVKVSSVENTSNLDLMNDLGASSETMKLERKNPHLILTDTLKKALKQPLPPGPPPKKPPRTFLAPTNESPEKSKKNTKKMLEKLEEVLNKRETQNSNRNIYDIAESDQSEKPKEIHYLCTNILNLTQKTLLPKNQNIRDPLSKCFNSLNCAMLPTNSTLSLPYTRLSSSCDSNKECCCCKENLNEERRLSTFLNESPSKCVKCAANDKVEGFKCHLNCKCREKKSEFYVEHEHIYDEPFVGEVCRTGQYGALCSWKGDRIQSRSMENLISDGDEEGQKIYDIPCEVSRPPTPDMFSKSEVQKLRETFENPKEIDNKSDYEKIDYPKIDLKKVKPTTLPPKPALKPVWKSSENVSEDFQAAKRSIEKKFATESKKYKKNEKMDKKGPVMSVPRMNRRNYQLDVDRENLNRLMSEIYETVTAVCNMDENKPGSFPTELSDSTSEESAKLTRSLTEKRKNYVRRVSSRVAYLDPKNVKSLRFRHQTSICSYKSEILTNPYSTFRSWKSFRTSQSNLFKDKMEDSIDSKIDVDSTGMSMDDVNDSVDNLSIDEKTGCVDIGLPFVPREKGLFNVCLLVGMNYMTGLAYVKNVFPKQVQVPPHIENLIFPETLSGSPGSPGEFAAEKNAQCYSLVLTDERGERAYGYCRRVLPEGATTCLPLCYCLIGKYRAPGFYYKILQEIESHHGDSEIEITQILQQLFETDFPSPGEQISITYSNKNSCLHEKCGRSREKMQKCKTLPDPRRSDVCSVSVKKESLDATESSAESPRTDSLETESDMIPDYYDLENNNTKTVILSLESPRTSVIKRPIEPRVDEDNMTVLLDSFGAGLVIKVFGSLLLERKVIIISDQLSVVSSCMEALQSALYPFVWQQPLISTIPAEIQRDVLEAPLPILAGMLPAGSDDGGGVHFEEGILIDLTHPTKVLFYQGDESTILPTSSYKTLKTSLQMESIKHKDKQEDTKTRNVMISETFLRFFVDILGDFWRFFSIGEVKDGDLGKNGVVFDKEAFKKAANSKQTQFFLEWFTETAMFNHFIQNMATCYHHLPLPLDYNNPDLVDTPLPNFYELFNERVRSRSKSEAKLGDKVNYKNAVNKKVKMLKNKLRELVA